MNAMTAAGTRCYGTLARNPAHCGGGPELRTEQQRSSTGTVTNRDDLRTGKQNSDCLLSRTRASGESKMATVIIGPFRMAYASRVPSGKNGPTGLKRRCFPRALVVSPERTAGQTACP